MFFIELLWLLHHPLLSDAHQNQHKDITSSDREAESPWLCIAGVAVAVVAGLVLLCWVCLQVQKLHSQKAVSRMSGPNPDTEQAAIGLVNCETGSTLLTGI